MNKNTKYILYFVCTIFLVILISYYLYVGGVTNKILGSASKLNKSEKTKNNINNYPIIEEVINSSGEKLVNTNVVLTIKAKSNYNITKILYSYDLKKWKKLNKKINGKTISEKLVFTNTIDKKVYIRVVNEKGYKSYAYKTIVKIDKKIPTLSYVFENNNLVINVKDNVKLQKLQYSYDNNEWVDEEVSDKSALLTKENFDYKYIRAVDSVGNISKTYEIEN